ncbi:MAG: hypothetical protein KDD35_11970 [Bdellovibrionales bacterium]|nr:hypothetical protein [Bdellovibrionales bacterium]
MARVRKPAIEAEAYETKKLSSQLPAELYDLLTQYAQFASEMQGKEVTVDGVVAGALRKIQTDKMFKEWLNNTNRKEQQHGTETRATANK